MTTGLQAAARRLALGVRTGGGRTGPAVVWLRVEAGATRITHPVGVEVDLDPDFFDAKSALVELLPVPRRGRPLIVELVVRECGRFELAFSAKLESESRVVLDEEFRLPGHPLPGMPLPEAAKHTAAPTDPAVLAEISALFHEFVERYEQIKGRPPALRPGYSEQEIAAAEAELGARLPEDLRALYRMTRDDAAETGLLGKFSPYPLDHVVEYHQPGSLGWNDGPFDDAVVFESDPPDTIKRLSRNDWWITFATDFAMNNLAVDLDPAERGRPGQVFEYGRDIHGPPDYYAESVADVLAGVVEALRDGDYEDDESDYLQTYAGFGGVGLDELVYHDFGNRDLAEIVDRAEETQLIHINDAVDLDLAALAPLRNLRELRINRAKLVTPTSSGLHALESLAIEAERIDVEALAGQPTLWDLKLAGAAERLDIAVLRTLPALTRLDLSAVELADITPIAELPQLRVLILNAAQWAALRRADLRPPNLAAVERTATCSLRETADWCEWLTGTPIQLGTTSGTTS
ncbi:Cell wall assembly regulator SMI1 [Saccharopolyspora antimicrobica]|uniref:Cell wall assembly regulator SMI1 n=1 Tax=Saccharopolyspora antimicrobica TaxID=455193 RepID=A0A1I5M6H6_9PSEU|nr:SMI1/KNR4 family protein [Saccharopolyspora antimicrobica]RKT82068.1 cell wall assembly regulator SMI1 [Saccharopolyspora antimicrobica]SFP04937.1 Cell wall assembly regulator SMI1 [Saccharopolyspora antimicrobica]